MKKFYLLTFFLCVLFFLNLIGSLAFFIYPKEIHQKYLLEKQEDIIIKKHNGLGAIGDSYKGQAFKIAFFGTSILESHKVNFNEKISQKLKYKLGDKKVHVDNFSIGWATVDSIILQMKALKQLGHHYDIILISVELNKKIRKDNRRYSQYNFHFSRRWMTENLMLSFPEQIAYFFKRYRYREKPLEVFGNIIDDIRLLFKWFSYNKKLASHEYSDTRRKVEKVLSGYALFEMEKKIRNHPLIQSKLADIALPQTLSSKKYKRILRGIKKLKKAGEEIADHIYLAPVRVIWHPDLPDSFYITTMIKKTKTGLKIHNSKSLHQSFNFYADEEVKMIKRDRRMKVVDYSKFIHDLINEKNYKNNPKELFLDEYHFSAKGSSLIADFLAKKFSALVEEKIKKQNKQIQIHSSVQIK